MIRPSGLESCVMSKNTLGRGISTLNWLDAGVRVCLWKVKNIPYHHSFMWHTYTYIHVYHSIIFGAKKRSDRGSNPGP